MYNISLLSENNLAVLSHYLHNIDNRFNRSYEREAIDIINKVNSIGLNDSTLSEVSVQYNLFPEFFKVPFLSKSNIKFTFIDLFAGLGGFRIALQRFGGNCVYSSENDPHAQQTYFENFGDFPFGDITNENVKSFIPSGFDILCAGFPCQPFSISGKQLGFEDTRGTLFFDICEIINDKNPPVVFLENVKHLIHHDGGRTMKVILEKLSGLGYYVSWNVLNGSDFGLPQNRERVIIIASKKKLFDFSRLKKQPRIALKYFLDKEGKFEYLDPSEYTLLEHPKCQASGLIFAGYRNKSIRKVGVRPGTEMLSRVHKQPNRIYSVDGIHPTLPSQEVSGRFFILDENKKVRKLTLSECWRLMGFPDEYKKIGSIGQQYKRIGNSVCVNMIEEIGKEIVEQLL